MIFNRHYELKDRHAFLSPSQHSWLNYDPEKLVQVFKNQLAIQRGTELHKLAEDMIRLKVKFGTKSDITLKRYVDDAIGFQMEPEVKLKYSENCFGTADAISFNKNILRIHDLKTGVTPASPKQLLVYAALFCLEYDVDPSDIGIELRIYQNDEKIILNPTVEDIVPVIDKIKTFDKIIEDVKGEDI